MPLDELSGPDLSGVVADANAVGLPYVVIGGFSVIAHGYLRATKDSDLLVPDGPDADEAILRFLDRIEAKRLSDGKVLTAEDVGDAHHLRVNSRHGIVDIMRGGLPPLDYETVAERAVELDAGGESAPFASLRSADSAIAGVARGRYGAKMQFGIAFGRASEAVPVPKAGTAEVLGYRETFRFTNDLQVFDENGRLSPNPRFKTAKQLDEVVKMEVDITNALCTAATGRPCEL